MFNIENQINDNVFVYYSEDTGNIFKISNTMRENNQYKILEIPRNKIEDVLLGKKKIEDYKIVYDTTFKQMFLTEITLNNSTINVNENLFKIPFTSQIEDTFIEQYKEIFVDIWYDELEHLKGQHVYYNTNVYRAKNYLPKNKKFNDEDFDLIVSNVKLLADRNILLSFESTENLMHGDLVLIFNKIYNYKPIINQEMIICKKDNCWIFTVNDAVRYKLKNNYLDKDIRLYFSFTKKNDPNILYRSVYFLTSDLINENVSIPFQYDFEYNNKSISIYTTKYFNSYCADF